MKPHTLPVKRRNVKNGIFKRLRAVTGNRKQRVAATANADEMEEDDGGSKISRALTIIFLIHIVAIGLIFVHQKFLDDRTPELAKTSGMAKPAVVATGAPVQTDRPRIPAGGEFYVVRQGDNYARIATTKEVDESDLRLINEHADIVPGMLLNIPPKRIIAVESEEVTAIRNQTPVDIDRGLVEAVPVDVDSAPRAQLVRPNMNRAATPAAASGKSYVVQGGDSVWRIANRFKVNQDALMKANGITDAKKMKVGMTLVIPN
jgi:LysM repeat protein